MRSHRTTRRAAEILILAAASYFVFWACAPMMSAPPSTPMPPPVSSELGHGVMGGAILQGEYQDPLAIGGYQFWARSPIGPEGRSEMGILAQAGFPSIISGGGYYRLGMLKSERAYLGAQVALGPLWFAASVPAAVKVGEKVWLTTQPSYKFQYFKDIHVPLGLSWKIGDLGRMDTEAGLHAVNFGHRPTSVVKSLKNGEDLALYVSLGFAKQFGKKN